MSPYIYFVPFPSPMMTNLGNVPMEVPNDSDSGDPSSSFEVDHPNILDILNVSPFRGQSTCPIFKHNP